jgi:predicted nucleotidyltransferase
MNALIRTKLPQIVEQCRAHRVKRLDLFGSALGSGFDPQRSDVDFVVEFLPAARPGFSGDLMGLKIELERLFGCEVDLVLGGNIRNPYFREELEETKVPVYAA